MKTTIHVNGKEYVYESDTKPTQSEIIMFLIAMGKYTV